MLEKLEFKWILLFAVQCDFPKKKKFSIIFFVNLRVHTHSTFKLIYWYINWGNWIIINQQEYEVGERLLRVKQAVKKRTSRGGKYYMYREKSGTNSHSLWLSTVNNIFSSWKFINFYSTTFFLHGSASKQCLLSFNWKLNSVVW